MSRKIEKINLTPEEIIDLAQTNNLTYLTTAIAALTMKIDEIIKVINSKEEGTE